MFERLKKAVKSWMQTAAADTGIAREFKDVFEVSGVPAFREFYNFCIFPCKYVYKGFYSVWHLIPAPTIENPRAKRNMFYLNLSKAVCAELAGMVWTDQTDVTVTTDGFTPTEANPDDPLQKFVDKVLKKNNFQRKMLECVEQAAALGGEALKVWADFKRDENGNAIPDSIRLKIGFYQADQFVPISWDNANVSEGVFISRQARGGYYYTQLEFHKWDGATYVITNELYRSDMYKMGSTEPQDILGVRIPLDTIFPMMDEETTIQGIEASLFSYFRTPCANNVDDNSPLGVSIYANAMETLHALDICYDSFVREFRLGKKRIIVPARAVRSVVDPQTGRLVRYFDANDEMYEALASDTPDDLKIQDNSVELRVEEHVSAINAFLSILCLQVGFSAGTFSFDQHTGLKTATEVVSENSKTYKTIKTLQNQIRPAIEHIVRNIIDVATLYGITDDEGRTIESLASGGYEVKIVFDDGVTQDRQTNLNEGVMLVGAGILSKKTFLTDPKYGVGMTKEEAEAELERIREEGRGSINPLAIFNTAE